MIITGHQRGNFTGTDASGARVECSPLVMGLEPPTQPRRPVVIPSYPAKKRPPLQITSIRDHWPKVMDTRAYHDDLEQRKKETTEKLYQENPHIKHKEA